jgi:hypothetical protein
MDVRELLWTSSDSLSADTLSAISVGYYCLFKDLQKKAKYLAHAQAHVACSASPMGEGARRPGGGHVRANFRLAASVGRNFHAGATAELDLPNARVEGSNPFPAPNTSNKSNACNNQLFGLPFRAVAGHHRVISAI